MACRRLKRKICSQMMCLFFFGLMVAVYTALYLLVYGISKGLTNDSAKFDRDVSKVLSSAMKGIYEIRYRNNPKDLKVGVTNAPSGIDTENTMLSETPAENVKGMMSDLRDKSERNSATDLERKTQGYELKDLVDETPEPPRVQGRKNSINFDWRNLMGNFLRRRNLLESIGESVSYEERSSKDDNSEYTSRVKREETKHTPYLKQTGSNTTCVNMSWYNLPFTPHSFNLTFRINKTGEEMSFPPPVSDGGHTSSHTQCGLKSDVIYHVTLGVISESPEEDLLLHADATTAQKVPPAPRSLASNQVSRSKYAFEKNDKSMPSATDSALNVFSALNNKLLWVLVLLLATYVLLKECMKKRKEKKDKSLATVSGPSVEKQSQPVEGGNQNNHDYYPAPDAKKRWQRWSTTYDVKDRRFFIGNQENLSGNNCEKAIALATQPPYSRPLISFREEFHSLPDSRRDWSRNNPLFEKDLARNYCWNRFPHIPFLEETRVVLCDDASSCNTYINANFITGYCNTNNAPVQRDSGDSLRPAVIYIAAASPFDTPTSLDLWRMIQQQGVRTVVTLTNVVEDGVVKCAQFWPCCGQTVHTLGHLLIQTVEERSFVHYTVRKIKYRNREEGFCAEVTQFQFTSWPENGLPESSVPWLDFRRKVRNHHGRNQTPILVHCGTGVSRTGSFIGLDIATDQYEAEGSFSLFDIVSAMRAQRPLMVRNLEQYIFIYTALGEYFEVGDTAVSLDTVVCRKRAELNEVNPRTGRTWLYHQFDLLNYFTSPEFLVGDNVSKGEGDGRVLNPDGKYPKDYFHPENKPVLKYFHINPVFVDGLRQKQAFALMSTTICFEFWEFVEKNDVIAIINLGDLIETEWGMDGRRIYRLSAASDEPKRSRRSRYVFEDDLFYRAEPKSLTQCDGIFIRELRLEKSQKIGGETTVTSRRIRQFSVPFSLLYPPEQSVTVSDDTEGVRVGRSGGDDEENQGSIAQLSGRQTDKAGGGRKTNEARDFVDPNAAPQRKAGDARDKGASSKGKIGKVGKAGTKPNDKNNNSGFEWSNKRRCLNLPPSISNSSQKTKLDQEEAVKFTPETSISKNLQKCSCNQRETRNYDPASKNAKTFETEIDLDHELSNKNYVNSVSENTQNVSCRKSENTVDLDHDLNCLALKDPHLSTSLASVSSRETGDTLSSHCFDTENTVNGRRQEKPERGKRFGERQRRPMRGESSKASYFWNDRNRNCFRSKESESDKSSESESSLHYVEERMDIKSRELAMTSGKILELLEIALDWQTTPFRNWFLSQPTSELPPKSAPLLIQAPEGSNAASLLCACALVCEQIQEDHVVDVYHTVKDLRRRMPGSVNTFAQYELIWDTLCNYVTDYLHSVHASDRWKYRGVMDKIIMNPAIEDTPHEDACCP